ncbi:MAG: N-methyl-L-tryptophan oxidase [Cyanophyceae cyanobacterium]
MTKHFDVIVVGAGGMGSAAAYYLSRARQRVLLLEQFELNHQKGSSYGYSRVIRYSYDNPIYVDLMRAAYPLWFALEEEAGETLYVQTGGLDFGLPSQPTFGKLRDSMDRAKLSYEHWSAAEAGDRFPQFRFDADMEALYQPDTGLLAASQCVLAHTQCAIKRGATLVDRSPVTQIKVGSDWVTVQTPSETYAAGAIVITAGSWAKQLLAQQGLTLSLEVMPCQLGFFEPVFPAEYEPGRFPVFFAHRNGDYGEMPYGIPSHDGSGLKVTTFYGWDTVSSPAQVDYTPDDDWVERMRGFIAQYLPQANGPLISTRRCLYTMTPDKDFIIDRHPEYSHIVVGAGFSGHGFKFSTLVGSILADLTLKGETEHNIRLFGLERFQSVVA